MTDSNGEAELLSLQLQKMESVNNSLKDQVSTLEDQLGSLARQYNELSKKIDVLRSDDRKFKAELDRLGALTAMVEPLRDDHERLKLEVNGDGTDDRPPLRAGVSDYLKQKLRGQTIWWLVSGSATLIIGGISWALNQTITNQFADVRRTIARDESKLTALEAKFREEAVFLENFNNTRDDLSVRMDKAESWIDQNRKLVDALEITVEVPE